MNTLFVDYNTLPLVNMSAGLAALAWFFLKGFGGPNEKPWAAVFAIAGLVAFAGGLHMTLAWPITQAGTHNLRWANPAYGETSVMLGVLFLGAALAVSRGWSLVPVAIYGLIAGVVAIVIGVAIGVQGLSNAPVLTCVGFILTGLGGPLVFAAVLAPAARWLRVLLAVDLHAAALLWLVTAVPAYWMHLEMLSK